MPSERSENRPKPTPPTVRAWQSVLEPHIEQIWTLRRLGKTYRQIAAEMGTLGVPVNASTVYRFVEARKRRILATQLPDLPKKRDPAAAQKVPAAFAPVAKPESHVLPQKPDFQPSVTPPLPPTSQVAGESSLPRVLSPDGKEIVNPRYAPANPDDL